MYQVLIVDDELPLRKGLAAMINWENEGFRVAGAVKDGLQALAFIEKEQVDFVITDLKMPNMDGMELIERLLEKSFEGLFLVLTNYSDFDVAVQSFRSGAVDYLLKATIQPDNLRSSLQKARTMLDKKRTTPQTSANTFDVFRPHFDANHFVAGVHALCDALPNMPNDLADALLLAAFTEMVMYFKEDRADFSRYVGSFRDFSGVRPTLLSNLAEQTDVLPIFRDAASLRRDITDIFTYVHANLETSISLSAIASHVNMNNSYLSRLFKKETGITLIGYTNMMRLRQAMAMLRQPNRAIKDVVNTLGYGNQSYFNKVFNEYCQMNPIVYRKLYTNR